MSNISFNQCNSANYKTGRTKPIQYIVIHYTANDGDTAAGNLNYFANNTPGASAHYFVDESTTIGQSVKDTDTAWHCGAATYKHDKCRNDNSIGIEMCSRKDGKGAYYFKDKVIKSTVELTNELMAKYNIPIENVLRHYDVTGKVCPAPFVNDSAQWLSFKNSLFTENGITKTPIMGAAVLTTNQLAGYLIKSNPQPKINCTAAELAAYFIAEGKIEGVRGDIAFCQAVHETGWFRFGGQVLPEQNNYCGLGATNNSPVGKGAWFDTPEIGVRAQMQHLKAYASKEPLVGKCVDPRFNLVVRGAAPNWTDLNGRWAVPGTEYGQSIIKVYKACPRTEELTLEGMLLELIRDSGINAPEYWINTLKDYPFFDGFVKALYKKYVG